MQRLILLAVFCLAGISGLLAIRFAAGVTAGVHGTPEAIAADVTDAATPLPKGDRLPSRSFDEASSKTSVETVKIIPPEVPKQQSEASKDNIVSWHWHEGSKVVRRRRAQ